MFRERDGISDEADGTSAPASSAPTAQAADDPAAAVRGSRYGEARRFNLPAVAITVVLHAAVLAAMLHVRHEVSREEEPRLVVVDLSQPPPPPPEAKMPPSPPRTEIAAPVPKLQIARPAPLVVTVPDPAPQPAPPVSVPPPPAPPAPSVVTASDLGTRLVSGEPPRYPLESRRRREEGTVLLSLVLDLDGSVSTISIARSSGFSRLDEAALRAVSDWRWAPTLREGEPVRVKGVVEIPFVLQG